MKSLGVDHVIFPDNGYYFDPVYAPKAIAQNFFPIYAFYGADPFVGVAFNSDPDHQVYKDGDLVVGAQNDATFGTNPIISPQAVTCSQMYNSEGLAVPLPTPGASVGPAYALV
jgi:hypothetical protein